MSNAYSLLLDTAVLLKLDANRITVGEETASLGLQGVEITVSCTKGAKNRSPMARAKFSCGSFSIESEPFLGDYAKKLAGMIKPVAYKKKYSAAWVGVAVKEQLAKKVKKCKVTLENDHVAILTLPATGGAKLQLSIVELSGNSIGSYYYRVDYLDGPTIGRVIDVPDLDKVIKDIADIAEGAYDKWVQDSKEPAQPKTDNERDMADLYQFLKGRYKNMRDSSLTFTRISDSELSITNISNGDRYFINYDSDKVCVNVLHDHCYTPSSKFFECDGPERFERVASVIFSDFKRDRKKGLERDY